MKLYTHLCLYLIFVSAASELSLNDLTDEEKRIILESREKSRRIVTTPMLQVYDGNLHVEVPPKKSILLGTNDGNRHSVDYIVDTLTDLKKNVTIVNTTAEKNAQALDGLPDLLNKVSEKVDRVAASSADNNTILTAQTNKNITDAIASLTQEIKLQVGNQNKSVTVEIDALKTMLARHENCTKMGKIYNGTTCQEPLPRVFTNGTAPTCDNSTAGYTRLNVITKTRTVMEVCLAGEWRAIVSSTNIGAQDQPAKDCVQLMNEGYESGTYWIQHPKGLAPFRVYCRNERGEGGGGWMLAMNIHNSDGHSSAWAAKNPFVQNGRNQVNPNVATYWLKDINYTPQGVEVPFGKDYKHQKVWNSVTPSQMMIVRHNPKTKDGNPTAYKVFDLTVKKPLLSLMQTTYRTRISNPARTTWSANGQDAVNRKCPLMRYPGFLLANFYYSNNGCRLTLSGHPKGTSGEHQNDDSTHGWGMEFASYSGSRRLSGSYGYWNFDTSIAECYREMGGSTRCAMGKDHSQSLNDGVDYGQYAFYIR